MIIDTHVHLNDEKYQDILDDVIKEAVNNNVCKFFNIGYNYESSLKAIEICKKYNGIIINDTKITLKAFIGIHPENVDDESSKNYSWIKELLKDENVIGIGEIGIDLYWTKDNLEKQLEFFRMQMDIACELGLPVVIHIRDAMQVTFDILKEYKGKVKGVVHCYSGSVEMAKEIVKLGYKLGVGGILTFKNSKLYEVIDSLDLSCFVTETDGPYLAPTPHRGELNKPSYIPLIVEKIASIKNIDVKTVERELEKNTFDIYGC